MWEAVGVCAGGAGRGDGDGVEPGEFVAAVGGKFVGGGFSGVFAVGSLELGDDGVLVAVLVYGEIDLRSVGECGAEIAVRIELAGDDGGGLADVDAGGERSVCVADDFICACLVAVGVFNDCAVHASDDGLQGANADGACGFPALSVVDVVCEFVGAAEFLAGRIDDFGADDFCGPALRLGYIFEREFIAVRIGVVGEHGDGDGAPAFWLGGVVFGDGFGICAGLEFTGYGSGAPGSVGSGEAVVVLGVALYIGEFKLPCGFHRIVGDAVLKDRSSVGSRCPVIEGDIRRVTVSRHQCGNCRGGQLCSNRRGDLWLLRGCERGDCTRRGVHAVHR